MVTLFLLWTPEMTFSKSMLEPINFQPTQVISMQGVNVSALPLHDGQHSPCLMTGSSQAGTGHVISEHISCPLWQ